MVEMSRRKVREMNKLKMFAAVTGIAAVALIGAACSSTPEPAAQPQAPAPAAPSTAVEPSVPANVPISASAPSPMMANVGAPVAMGAPSYSGSYYTQYGSPQTGIWVTGESTMMAQPDMVTVNLGVETTGKTVAEANGKAAEAMDAMINALKARGLTDRDIQTNSYNVWPQYEYGEVVENGIRRGKQTLVGYQVSNSASVKIRDLDSVGEIIDEVATAGGDATRINGIYFSVEDPKPFMNGLREAAVKDALAKAQQFADLTNVKLGNLVYISELGGSAPVVVQEYARAAMDSAMMAPASSTPISSGELQFSMSVQAVFAIQ